MLTAHDSLVLSALVLEEQLQARLKGSQNELLQIQYLRNHYFTLRELPGHNFTGGRARRHWD